MRIVISTLIAICVFMFSSCSPEKPKEVNTNGNQKEAMASGDVANNTLYQKFDTKIQSLENTTQNLASDVLRLQRTIDNLAKFDTYAKIALILAGVAALLSVVSLIVAVSKGRKRDQGKSQKPPMETRPYADNQVNTRLTKLEKDALNFKKTIQDLEKRIESQLSAAPQPVVPKIEKYAPKKVGYAALNSKAYFMNILSSNQEGAIYKIEFKSENKGEFDLISLDKIKSMDGWKDVVDTMGDCVLEKANDYSVVEKGVCERTSDGKTWKVVKKLKIRLKK